MARHAHEFQCTNCNHWNYPMLDECMSGNYTVICGNLKCKHEHYRHIKDGVVTEDRHNSAADHGDTIHVMPSATQSKKKELGKIAQFRQKVMAGLAK